MTRGIPQVPLCTLMSVSADKPALHVQNQRTIKQNLSLTHRRIHVRKQLLFYRQTRTGELRNE